MKRDIYHSLITWKKSDKRKPLILQGARQVGKTYILKEFGSHEYGDTAYFNFEANPALSDFFKWTISPQKILEKLSIYRERPILPEKTLVIFDEIQLCPEALTSLKYFQEEAGKYHIAAAGSLLGIRLGRQSPFPVGKVNFLNMYPLSFGEYLDGIGKSGLRELLRAAMAPEPFEAAFHEELLENLRLYYFIGGMPEAIEQYKQDKDLAKVRTIHSEILTAYLLDISKHASKTEAIKIAGVWNSIPGQLAKENKKFKFSGISENARAREYAEPIHWLAHAGLVHKCLSLKTPRLPLSGYCEENVFKLYLLDTGLLGAMLNLSQKTIVEGNRLFSEYNGAFTESYVAQELIANGHKTLYYWANDAAAEVDFVMPYGEEIFPLEVKAGMSRHKTSLSLFGEKYASRVLSMATLRNLTRTGKVCNYPLYAVSLFPELGKN
jgi:predicted AAA+ superfamily ATPase